MKTTMNTSPFRSAARSSGLTIVEVMMATMVLAVAIGSSILVLGTGFSLVELARDSTMASQILQSEMENLRLKKWSDIEALEADQDGGNGKVFDLSGIDFEETVAARFTCTRWISDVDEREGLKRVELEAMWRTNNGIEHRRHYVTYFAKEGLNDYYYRSF